jgi:putative FmdB family regulatory protein
MPIYEYVCEKCGSHTEVMQRVSDEPLKRCSSCRGKLEKIISRTSFQLKGSGWYATDYSKSEPGSKKEETQESQQKSETKVSDSTCGAGACGACD